MPDAQTCACIDVAEYGLYPATTFVYATGAANPGHTSRQARWYFAAEWVGLPREHAHLPTPARGLRAAVDVERWAGADADVGTLRTVPPIVWVAAPDVVAHARLSPDGALLAAGRHEWSVELVPQSPLIDNYFNAATARWFAQREVRVRATIDDARAIVRTVWPQDFTLPPAFPAPRTPLEELTAERVRALVRRDPHGGAEAPFEAACLWARPSGTSPRADSTPPQDAAAWVPVAGRPVIGFILNAAQGDDDEAHGGHFAIVIGRMRDDGSIADWLVHNFYSLDVVSEKSIIAAPVPLDNYLADLNSGQCYYRPSVLAAAVLASDRAANALQDALNRVYVQFYRHQLVYRHAAMNCAGISVDVLRALGVEVSARGAAAPVRVSIGLPWLLLRQGWRKACSLYDYLTEDLTRLLPAVAFEEIVGALDRCARGRAAGGGLLGRWLRDDMEALLWLRFPQFPTARPPGDAAVVNAEEYRARWPKDPSQARIFPVPPRPFPDELRDDDVGPPPRARSSYAMAAWTALLLLVLCGSCAVALGYLWGSSGIPQG